MGISDLWAAALSALSEEDRQLVAFEDQPGLDVLSELGQLVNIAKENSIKKRWQCHRPCGGQTVILRDLFSKIVVWLDRFKEIGDIVVQYDPVHAALPWAGVRFLLQLAVSDIKKFAFIVEGAETIACTITRYATFEQLYLVHGISPTRAVKGLEKALVKLYAVILVYLGRAKTYFEEPTPKRMAKAAITSQSDFEALLANIHNELANVDRHAVLVDAEHINEISDKLVTLSTDQHEMHVKLTELLRSIDSPICRISPQLNSLEDQLQRNIICANVWLLLTFSALDSERVEILRWLSPQPYMDHHKQIKKQALPRSERFVLAVAPWKIGLWQKHFSDMIARFEAGQSALPVYFYCTRSAAEPERSNPQAVLASILRQLSCVQPGAPILPPVIEKYKRHGEGFKSNSLDLDDSRDLIIKLIEDYSMTIIIVDALDECDPLMRQSLLDAFEHILKESAGLVKIFVSSRNDQDIVWTLRDYPNMDISSDRNTGDIENYVETETRKLVENGHLLRNSRAKEEMTTSIIKQVSDGADGMFRWASLQLDVLRALKRDEDIRARLGKLPPKLEDLYLEVYNNLISAQGEVGRSIINNALKWLLCAKEELHGSLFLRAVAVNLGTSEGDVSVDSLLDLCNNFVLYDEALDVFRFAHLSVREFLEQKPEYRKISCYSLSAKCCLLQMIASSSCQNIEHFVSDEHRLRLRENRNSTNSWSDAGFLEYANRSWMDYCQMIPLSERLDDSEFGQLYRFFFSHKLESALPLEAWVKWYCGRVLRDKDSAVLLKLQALLTRSSDSLSISFFIATCFGFSELVASYVEDRRLGDETKDQGLLLAAMAAQHEVFDILSQTRKNWAMTEPLLVHAVRSLDKERLAWLLDKAADTMITNRVFAAVAEDPDDEKMAILLDRYPDMSITERMLEDAFGFVSLEGFKLLVARTAKPTLTHKTLRGRYCCKSGNVIPIVAHSEKLLIILDRMKESDLTPRLMASAMALNDKFIIQAILKKGGAGNITNEVIVQAAQSSRDTFLFMLQNGGKVTEKVLDQMASRCDAQAWQTLLEQGYELNVNVERLKLAALNCHHGDAVLSILLKHADDTMYANDIVGLILDVARHCHNESIGHLLDRAKYVEFSQDMLLAAILNPFSDRPLRVKMFLDRLSEVEITEDMLVLAAGDLCDGVELTRMFLGRRGDTEVSEYILMAVACNACWGYEIMQLLLERNSTVDLTEDVLICAASHSNPDLLVALLERFPAKVPMRYLLEAAAVNPCCGDDLLKLLLERAKVTELPEAVFLKAIENRVNGIKVILVLEETFGRISLTESLMAKCFHKASHAIIELLLCRISSVPITQEVLIGVIRSDVPYHEYVQLAVAEKSLHIPITTEILVSAAQYGTLKLFRFLWNRGPSNSVPEDLTIAAAKSKRDGCIIIEFLLDEVDFVEIGEATLIALVSNRGKGWNFFKLLLGQSLQADTTEGVPNTLLMKEGIKFKCSSPTSLQLSKGMKVTEDMFRVTASCGNESLLVELTNFCKVESVPERWLNIARLYNAAERDNMLLKTLLGRGVEPDVASPDGYTPLCAANVYGNSVAIQMLLSAGALPDGGPNLGYSPLCSAAQFGDYYLAKRLVNAGASLDFRDDKGRTPSMIAKASGKILVFKYLEECRIEQEGRQKETPMSI